MADLTAVEIASILKDGTLTGVLVWVLHGVIKRIWVPGIYYTEACARAEKAEAHSLLAHDTADRATRVSEQLVAIVGRMER